MSSNLALLIWVASALQRLLPYAMMKAGEPMMIGAVVQVGEDA